MITITQDNFFINGTGSASYSCLLLRSYSITGPTITRTRLAASKGQNFRLICTRYGLLTIKLPVHVFGTSPEDVAQKESKLRAALLNGIVELTMPDGYYYTSVLESAGESSEISDDGCVRSLTFTLSGYRHGALQKQSVKSGAKFRVSGTAAEMACRLTATVGTAATTYVMSSAVWVNVAKGDKLVLDGMEHTATKNGANAIGSCDIVEWPTLQAGYNTVTCPDALTVEYYPIWI